MYIKNISLENYRNYENFNMDFHREVNIILGENGQGKTNLLESIYAISMGKSFKSIKDKEIIKFDKEFFRVKSEYERDNEIGNIEFYFSKTGSKAIKIDGVNIKKISQLMDNIITVIFSPEDLYIIKEEPSKRRSFIDRELSQLNPIYFSYLSDYKKVLINKNTSLKENNVNKEMLRVYNEQLAFYGSKILKSRIDFIEKLKKISRNIHFGITDGNENFNVVYNPDIEINLDWDEWKIKKIFEETLERSINNDIFRKTSTRGVHRDDFQTFINDIDVRKFGSQGQQRTAALSLKLAEINLIREDKNINPILLLDDVMSELDYKRQKFLINTIKNVQIFLTTTDMEERMISELPKGKVIRIKNGDIF